MTPEEYKSTVHRNARYAELQNQIDECQRAIKTTERLRTKSYSSDRPWLTFGDGYANGERVPILVDIADIVLDIIMAHTTDKIARLRKKQREL